MRTLKPKQLVFAHVLLLIVAAFATGTAACSDSDGGLTAAEVKLIEDFCIEGAKKCETVQDADECKRIVDDANKKATNTDIFCITQAIGCADTNGCLAAMPDRNPPASTTSMQQ